jgi:hypothetical protein
MSILEMIKTRATSAPKLRQAASSRPCTFDVMMCRTRLTRRGLSRVLVEPASQG